MDEEIIEQTENLIVMRALKKRCGSFMFNYAEGHTDKYSEKSSDPSESIWEKLTPKHQDYDGASTVTGRSKYKSDYDKYAEAPW